MTDSKVSKSNVILVLVALTLLFLLGIQVSWLQSIADFEKQQFEKKVNRILEAEVSFGIFRTTELTGFHTDVSKQISFDQNLYKTPEMIINREVPSPSRLLRKQEIFQHLLDSLLRAAGIEDRYVFGTRILSEDHFDIISNEKYLSELLNSPLEECINCIEVVKRPDADSVEINGVKYPAGDVLINSSVYSDTGELIRNADKVEVLQLYFPRQGIALYRNVPFQMAAAVVSILILFGLFFYLFRLFSRQKRLSEMKKDFVNNLTHELKTPIASILLSTKVLGKSKTVSMTNQDKSFLTLIQNEGKRLENQVDKVLQIAMIDSDNFTLNEADTDLHQIVENVIASLQVIIGQRKAQVSLNLDANQHVISGDETHLFNLIYNLVENALKYSEDDPKVYVRTENQNGHISITIKDEGLGITREAREHIFDRFYRGLGKDIYKEKGFGLGLSYVKSIVDAHQGSISVESEPGMGAIFTVKLNTK